MKFICSHDFTSKGRVAARAALPKYVIRSENRTAPLCIADEEQWEQSLKLIARIEDNDVEDATNRTSLDVAKAIVSCLRLGGNPAPYPSADADGDVLLTWQRGNIRGTLVVAGERLNAIVTEGTTIAFVGGDLPANLESLKNFEHLYLEADSSWRQMPIPTSSISQKMTLSVDSSFCLEWPDSEEALTKPSNFQRLLFLSPGKSLGGEESNLL